MALTKPHAYQIYDIDYKQATRVVTVTNVPFPGGAPDTVDGVTLVANDRVLVTGQTTQSQNGVYVVVTLGTGSNGTWTRSGDTDVTGELLAGAIIMVTEGLIYADTQWKLITDNPITIGTTPLVFTQNYLANVIQAGTSNVTVYSNADITVTSANTANVLTVSNTGIAVLGVVSVSGNITTGGLITVTGNVQAAGFQYANGVPVEGSGAQGATGAQGTQGVEGPQGTQGTQGIEGIQGTQGIYGAQGTTGTDGTSVTIIGSVLTVGADPQATLNAAFPGAVAGNGVIADDSGNLWVYGGVIWSDVGQIVGAQGTTGAQGTQGIQGTEGAQGIQGTEGAQGTTGIQGTQGITGAQGATGSFDGNLTANLDGQGYSISNIATLSATGNVTGGNLVTSGDVTTSGNVIGNNVSVLNSGTISTGGNVLGNNIIVSGTISAVGNITANVGSFFIGNGSQLTGVVVGPSNAVQNGNSNITIPVANGSILFAVGGEANTLVIDPGSLTMYGSFANPKVIAANIAISPNVNAVLYGPLNVDEGVGITVPTSSTLYIIGSI